MSLGLVGRKIGMTRIFTDDGDSHPVTVLDVSNNRVTQIKTPEQGWIFGRPGGFWQAPRQSRNKPSAGHFAKAAVEAGHILKEFRVDAEVARQPQAGGSRAWILFRSDRKWT